MTGFLPAVRGISEIKVTDRAGEMPGRLAISWRDAAGDTKEHDFFGASARKISEALRSGDAISMECRAGILLGIVLGKTTG